MSLPLASVLKAMIFLQKIYLFSSAVILGAAIGLNQPSYVWIAVALVVASILLRRLRRQLQLDAYRALEQEIIKELNKAKSKASSPKDS